MKKNKTRKISPKIGHYAFWTYDLFPYTLGGQIIGVRDSGSVEIKEYGKGFYFNPFMVLPPKRGAALMKELESLDASYSKATADVFLAHKDRLKDLIEEHPMLRKLKQIFSED